MDRYSATAERIQTNLLHKENEMDTGQGRFEQVDANNEEQLEQMKKLLQEQYPQHGGWFREGEVVELKGSRFRVKRIKPTEITLKLLKRGEQ
jgi:nitroimidazol reductase NimA-like FMN-containing flavoprotein (pyridoxamine 5'-phosphate oxidase superfamily)